MHSNSVLLLTFQAWHPYSSRRSVPGEQWLLSLLSSHWSSTPLQTNVWSKLGCQDAIHKLTRSIEMLSSSSNRSTCGTKLLAPNLGSNAGPCLTIWPRSTRARSGFLIKTTIAGAWGLHTAKGKLTRICSHYRFMESYKQNDQSQSIPYLEKGSSRRAEKQ